MKNNPLVSVLMPYRKKDAFFDLALKSLEKQSYSRIEILTEEDRNGEGIAILLNRLAKRAKGEFLARMDADDVSEPDRIEKQVKYLNSHPETVLVGSWATLIDESGRKIGLQKMPVSWGEIKQQAFFRNPLIHPSWMMRRKWFEKNCGYDEAFPIAQDWELVSRRVWAERMENIPETLVRLRIHSDSTSFISNSEQVKANFKIRWNMIKNGDVSRRRVAALALMPLSLLLPAKYKYFFLKGVSLPYGKDTPYYNSLGIVLPMGQSRKVLKESGQWSLWESELAEYRKVFGSVELFEYRYRDFRRFFEALIFPIFKRKRFRRCAILKAVHLTGVAPCLIAKFLYGTRYILSYGYRYDKFAALERKWGAWLLAKMLTPIAIKFADAVIVPTQDLKNYVLGLGAEKIAVIPNGVDIERFASKQKTKNKKQEAINILFVGRLEKQKNLETLIKAISVVSKGSALHWQGRALINLQFVGFGSLRSELLELAARLNVNLEIKGTIPNEKLPEVYRQADIFVLPSLAEGHPKALLEAMSCGLACLASDIAGVNEIIIDGRNGLLVEPTIEGIAEGLERLAVDSKLREKLGKAARETVAEKFDKKKLIKREISLIRPGLAAARPGL